MKKNIGYVFLGIISIFSFVGLIWGFLYIITTMKYCSYVELFGGIIIVTCLAYIIYGLGVFLSLVGFTTAYFIIKKPITNVDNVIHYVKTEDWGKADSTSICCTTNCDVINIKFTNAGRLVTCPKCLLELEKINPIIVMY